MFLNRQITDFNYFLTELKKGEIMDETCFFFIDENGEPEHYIGCILKYDKPFITYSFYPR